MKYLIKETPDHLSFSLFNERGHCECTMTKDHLSVLLSYAGNDAKVELCKESLKPLFVKSKPLTEAPDITPVSVKPPSFSLKREIIIKPESQALYLKASHVHFHAVWDILQSVFGFSLEEAKALAIKAHHGSSALVYAGDKLELKRVNELVKERVDFLTTLQPDYCSANFLLEAQA